MYCYPLEDALSPISTQSRDVSKRMESYHVTHITGGSLFLYLKRGGINQMAEFMRHCRLNEYCYYVMLSFLSGILRAWYIFFGRQKKCQLTFLTAVKRIKQEEINFNTWHWSSSGLQRALKSKLGFYRFKAKACQTSILKG